MRPSKGAADAAGVRAAGIISAASGGLSRSGAAGRSTADSNGGATGRKDEDRARRAGERARSRSSGSGKGQEGRTRRDARASADLALRHRDGQRNPRRSSRGLRFLTSRRLLHRQRRHLRQPVADSPLRTAPRRPGRGSSPASERGREILRSHSRRQSQRARSRGDQRTA